MKPPKPEVAKEPALIAETPAPAPVEAATIAETPAPAPIETAHIAETALPAEGETPQPDSKPGPSVVVIGPPQGRWRIGRKFGAEPVSIPLSDLTKDEMDRLGADPLLVCQVIDAPY